MRSKSFRKELIKEFIENNRAMTMTEFAKEKQIPRSTIIHWYEQYAADIYDSKLKENKARWRSIDGINGQYK